jgi:hypothetical protein
MTAKFDKNIPEPPVPTWRKPIGMLVILLFILIWCGVVVTLMDKISALNFWLQLPIYIFAGIVWIYPIKPILLWMNTGKFRQ